MNTTNIGLNAQGVARHNTWSGFFNEVEDYLFIADENGCIMDANAAAIQKLSYPIELLRDMNLTELFSMQQRSEIVEAICITKTGQSKYNRVSLADSEGRTIPVENTFFKNVIDGVITINCISHDVVAHFDDNEKFLKLFNNYPVSIAISNIDTTEYVDVNEFFVETIGYEKNEVMGKKVQDLKLFVDQSLRDKIVIETLEHGYVRNREVQIRDKHGYIHNGYFSATSVNIRGERLLLASFSDMTYAQKTELQKITIEAQMRAVQDNMPFISWLKDINGCYMGINMHFEKAAERKAIDIIGKSDHDVWPAEIAEAYRVHSAQAVTTQKQVFFETQFRGKTEDQWYEIYITPIFDNKEQVIGTAGISKPITERKKLEIELKNQKKMLKSMIDVIPDLIFYKDTNSVYLGCNSAFSDKFIGLSESEIVGKTDLHFVKDVELANFFREKDRIVLAATETISNEETITLADGSIVDIETAKTPFFDDSGSVAGLIGVSRDITARIAAQKELEHKEKLLSCVATSIKELLYERNYYEAIQRCFESLGVTMDVSRICLFQNEADHTTSLKMEWFSSDKMAHANEPMLHDIPFDSIRDLVKELSAGQIFGRHVQNLEWGAFKDCIEKNKSKSIIALPIFVGRTFWGFIVFEESKFERIWTDSEVSMLKAFIGSLEKAIERSQIEEELERSKRHAEMSNRAKSVFLSNMNHELRTPLNAILGFSELLTREKDLSEQAKVNLRIIRRSGEHLLSLINDVLNLSKIEAGQITLSNQSYDFHHLLKYLYEIFLQRAEAKNLVFEMHQDPTVPKYVIGDEIKVRQILMNLLSNAVKFTERGSVSLTVSTVESGKATGDLVEISFCVADTGPGIDASEMNDLFTPFVQTKTGKESKEGTGLGLTISRNFIMLMGGELQVESECGRGTVFAFNIKMKKCSDDTTTISETGKRVVAIETGQPIFRLLIVDDILDNRHLISSMLGPFGFELKDAQNGKEALDIWKEWKPHLIWMDIRMPVMDGYEATKIIKEFEDAHKLPTNQRTVVVGVSASTFDEEKETVLESGFDDFVRKPVLENTLFEQMHKHLGLRYVCEETGAKTDQDQMNLKSEYSSDKILSDLKEIPLDLLCEIETAAVNLNMNDMKNCIHKIKGMNIQLAEALKEMADDFRYDEILRFLPMEIEKQ